MMVLIFLVFLTWKSLCLNMLTPENVEETLEKVHTAMILARVTKCDKCIEFRGAFNLVKEKTDGKVIVFEMDIEKYPQFLKKYVKLFGTADRRPTAEQPVILFSKYGRVSLYDGPQEIDGFVNYLKEAPKIKQILTNEQKREFLANNANIKVLGYFRSAAEINKAFKRVAHMYSRELLFGVIYKKKIAKTIGLKKFDQVLVAKPLEDRIVFKPKKKDMKEYFKLLRDFVETNQECTICPVTSRNVASMFRSYYNVMIGFVDTFDSPDTLRFLDNMRDVAQDYFKTHKKSEASTIFSYTIGAPVEDYLKSIGMTTIQYPAFLGLTQLEQKKFFFDRGEGDIFLYRDLKAFVESYFEDTLKPNYVSEPIPDDNDVRPVKILTAENFDKEVVNLGRSSMVFLTRETCPYCAKIKPVEDYLGKHYQIVEDVMVGEFDITKNSNNFQLEHVPTVYWFPNCVESQTKQKVYIEFPVVNKTVEEFVEFVEENRCGALDQVNQFMEGFKEEAVPDVSVDEDEE